MSIIEQLHPQYIKDPSTGSDSYVILPKDEFDELIEDIEDLAVFAKRKDEDTISFEEVKKELGFEL